MNSTPEQSLRDTQHFGEEGGVVPVIDVAATSTFLNPKDMERTFQGEMEGCYLYSRHSNPSVNIFSKKIAAMEAAESALGVSSGMAAIACAIEHAANGGGHIISSQTVYGGTYALLKNHFPKRNITTTFVNIDHPKELESALQKNTKVLYVETLSNPLLNFCDFKNLRKFCDNHNLILIVDNTFTPLLVSPIKWGADVVIHSCTKYISGSSDLIAGVVASSKEFIKGLVDINYGVVMLTGPVMDARIAHELYMRLDHLPIRMRAHSTCAQTLAQRMHEEKTPVIYPGLKNHPHHERMQAYINPTYGFGGMMAIDCKTIEKAMMLAQALQDQKFGLYAVSLGFSRTLMSCSSISTSSEIPHDEQKKMNLSPGLLRLSIGYTGEIDTMYERFKTCYKKIMK